MFQSGKKGWILGWFSAINAKQFTIVFNKAVDKDSAEKAANYSVVGLSLADASAALQADGKTVILTIDDDTTNDPGTEAKLANYSKYNVTVKNVKDTAGKAIDATTVTNVQLSDVSIPTFSKLEVTGPNKVKVYFSEPVKATTTDFTVDNGSIGVTNAKVLPSSYAIELTLSAELANGDHKVVINNTVVDYVGYATAKSEQTFTVAKDAAAPTVSVKKATPNKITLLFNKPVKNLSGAEIKVGYNKIASTNVTSEPTDVDANGYASIWYVDMGTNYIGGDSATVSIKNNASLDTSKVVDRWGNKLVDTTLTASIVADNVKPAATTIEALSASQVKVTFNKSVTEADAENRMNYTLLDKTGAVASITGVTDSYGHPLAAPVYDDDNKQATVTFGGDLSAENYSLKVDGIKDTIAYNQQKIDATTLAFSVADKTKLQLGGAAYDSVNRKITLTFNKSVAQTGEYNALDAKNYTIAGKVLPTGSSVTLGSSDKVVVITVGGADAPTGTLVATIKDAQDSLIDVTHASAAIAPASISSSDMRNFKLVDANTVTFDVLKPLTKVVSTGATVDSKAVVSASFVNQNVKNADGVYVYGSTVTLKTDKDTGSLGTVGGAWNVVLPNQSVETMDGAKLASSTIAATVKDYAAPKITEIDTLDTDKDGMIDEAVIAYSEAVKAADVTKAAYSVDGYTVKDAFVSSVSGARVTDDSASYVTVKFDQSGKFDTGAKPAVEQIKDVRDASVNENAKTAEVAPSVATTDKAQPELVGAALSSDSKTLTLTFSEPVTTDSAYASTGFSALTTSDLAGLGLTSATVNHISSAANTITITDTAAITGTSVKPASATSIYDFAGNAAPTTSERTLTGVAVTGVTGSLVHTTSGVQAATQSSSYTLTGPASATANLTVEDGSTDIPVAVTSGQTAVQVGDAIRTACASSSLWTVGGTGATVTFTAKSPAANVDAILSGTVAGLTLGSQTDAIPGNAGTKQVETYTVSHDVDQSGTISVTFNDGGTPVVKTVDVSIGDTATKVAGDIASAFSSLDGYTVTTSGATVVFTASAPVAQKAVTVTVVNK